MDLQTANANGNRNNIDSELTAFQKLQSDLKNTIFGVLYVLLKEQELSIYTAFALSIIQFLQIGLFAFHDTVAPVWNASDITDVLNKIYGFFNLIPYIKYANWNVYILFFYVGIVIVALAILDMFYISFTTSRKKLFFTWPMIALRNILTLFTTIFFYPFLDYFVSVLACVDDESGQSVHEFFSEVNCWTGIHILHAIFAILGSIFFVAFSLVASLTYFEYKSNLNNPTARVTSRPNFILNIYQAIMIVTLTFLTASQFQVILIVMILLGSLLLFLKFYYNSPYHDETLAKLWSVLTALNLWTAFMLLCARIMEGVIFDGVVIAWILGLPFVVFLLLTIKDHRMDLLLINVNKFQNGAEVQNQIRYILKLIQWQSTDKKAGILLDGYIEIHKQTCNKDDCPIRQKVVKNNRFTKAIMNQDETLTEKYALLIQKLYMMYFYGIKKFPQDTSLRISYSFFLLEKMHSKQQALQELGQAESNNPSFDEQFIIYRYKKLIEDEIAESQTEGQGGLDVISEVAFQTHLRQLQANIEKSALLHLEFWSQLAEDNPDLSKLSDIGSKINSSTQYVEETWSKLLKINPNNPKSMRLYGKFLVEIINDKETGEDLLEKARAITSVQTGKKLTNFLAGVVNDYGEATPSISVSGEQDTFGLITSCNLVAASLFGYNKTELLNRKVNVLMSQVFSKYHDSFLENYLNSGESIIIGKNKERFVFGKNKTNYIFPVYLSIRAVQSIIQGIQFIATFRSEKNFKSSAYIVTTQDGSIDAVSSSCINVLKIDLKQVSHKKTNIQDFIPNIIKNRYNLFSSANNNGRSSAIFTFDFPKDSEYFSEGEEPSTQVICYLNEISFQSVKESPGLQFRFERLSDKNTNSLQMEKKAKISNFQFKFDKNKPTVIGEYVEGSLTESQSGPLENEMLSVLNKSTMEGDHSLIDGAFRDTGDGLKSSQQQQQNEEPEIRRVDYGIGIKTLRLINGKPQEIDEDKSDDNDEEAEDLGSNGLFGTRNPVKQPLQQQIKQQEEESPEEGSLRDFNTTFKSRKALNLVINDKTPPGAIRNLKIIANALCLVLFLLSIFDYVVSTKKLSGIKTNIDLLDKSNQQLAEMMTALSKMRDLHMLQLGVTVADEATLRNDLMNALDNAKTLKEYLESETSGLSSAHLDLYNNPVIEIYDYGSSTPTLISLTQAIEAIISKAFEIWSTTITEITDTNEAYYYVTYNSLNNFYIALQESSTYYTEELVDKVSDKNGSFLPFLVASGAALFLSVLILFPILYQVNKTREEVLSLFLDIPEKTVKALYNKCESFISNLQVGEEDDIISEVDEEELEKRQEDNDSQEFLPRKKRKRFKNSDRSPNVFFLKYFIMAAIVEGYFVYNFVSSSSLLDNINTIIVELNATSVAEGFYSFANNAERQLFIDSSVPIINEAAETVATDNIKLMYTLDSLILQEHAINRKIHSDSYNTAFNQIIMTNPCSALGAYVRLADCQDFADGTVSQGMTVGLTRHFENLRTLLSCYTTLESSGTCTISVTDDLSLMLTTQAEEIETMQDLYIKETFRLLMAELKVSLNDNFDSAITRRLILFVIFLVFVVVLYIVIWLPLMRTISNDIWKTKSMLTMIPIQVVAKIKSIRLYIKRFWNERNLVES